MAGPDVTIATPTLLLDLEYPAALNAEDCQFEFIMISISLCWSAWNTGSIAAPV